MKTVEHKKIFVFAKKNIRISDDLFIDKDDVGIVETKTEKGALIFFIRAWKIAELNNEDFKVHRPDRHRPDRALLRRRVCLRNRRPLAVSLTNHR